MKAITMRIAARLLLLFSVAWAVSWGAPAFAAEHSPRQVTPAEALSEMRPAFEMPPLPTMPRASTDAPDLLLAVGDMLGKEVRLDDFLQTLVDRVAAAMSADRGTLYLLDPARGELFSRAAHLPELNQIRLKLGQGVAGHVAQTGALVNMPEPQGESRFFPEIDRLTGEAGEVDLAPEIVDVQHGRGHAVGVANVRQRGGELRLATAVDAIDGDDPGHGCGRIRQSGVKNCTIAAPAREVATISINSNTTGS